jgi:tetratricopeptide (TPR) repeat protein
VEEVFGHARYGMFETIRQFAEEQLAVTDDIAELRDAHARYFAAQAVRYYDIWHGSGQREALDWVDVEFANLRAGFRWAADHHDLDAATAIAAHTAFMKSTLQRYESIGWAIELLDAATRADLPQLPRLYSAASNCIFLGRPEDAVRYAQTALGLEADPRYHGFRPPLTAVMEAAGHGIAGRVERAIEICFDVAARPGPVDVFCLAVLCWVLTGVGRDEEARTLAAEAIPEDSLAVPHPDAIPDVLALAFASGHGLPYARSDPQRALSALRQALVYCREHRLIATEGFIAYRAAGLEASHGDADTALDLFDLAIDGLHRAGDQVNLAQALGSLADYFERVEQAEPAARIYGASTHSPSIAVVPGLQATVQQLRTVLGDPDLDRYVAAGAAMQTGDAVAYARQQIRRARNSTDTIAPSLGELE